MDHEAREVMIPMRDGVKLRTVILIPKGAKHEGILLTRTPYDAHQLSTNLHSEHLGTRLWDTTTPRKRSSKGATSGCCRIFAASMAAKATT